MKKPEETKEQGTVHFCKEITVKEAQDICNSLTDNVSLQFQPFGILCTPNADSEIPFEERRRLTILSAARALNADFVCEVREEDEKNLPKKVRKLLMCAKEQTAKYHQISGYPHAQTLYFLALSIESRLMGKPFSSSAGVC